MSTTGHICEGYEIDDTDEFVVYYYRNKNYAGITVEESDDYSLCEIVDSKEVDDSSRYKANDKNFFI